MDNKTLCSWEPNTDFTALKARALLLNQIRQFFFKQGVLEVETPLIDCYSVTDPYTTAIPIRIDQRKLFMQTSPEYAMKRLLASGSGAIFQICKAFRADELSTKHNTEFTMLEWYRPGFDHHKLIAEVDSLLQDIIDVGPAIKSSYKDLFKNFFDFDPHTVDLTTLRSTAEKNNIILSSSAAKNIKRADWHQLLMTHIIEPQLTGNSPWIIYDYPVEQAALANIRNESPPVSERFEVYFNGLELANGYHELTDATEQMKRFEQDCRDREQLRLAHMLPDIRLLQALKSGLPKCSGVAVGIDRLLMAKEKIIVISKVITFTL